MSAIKQISHCYFVPTIILLSGNGLCLRFLKYELTLKAPVENKTAIGPLNLFVQDDYQKYEKMKVVAQQRLSALLRSKGLRIVSEKGVYDFLSSNRAWVYLLNQNHNEPLHPYFERILIERLSLGLYGFVKHGNTN